MASNFSKLKAKLAENPKITNPGAVAASIGRKKYGAETMKQAAKRKVSAASIASKKAKKVY